MIPQPLDLPDAPEWTAKALLVELVAKSPLLSGKVNVYAYEPSDGPMADADPDNLPRPFIRLHIRPMPSSWFASGIMKYPFEMAMELGVDGLYDRPLLALWHAVRTALSDQQLSPGGQTTVREVKQAARIAVSEMQLADYAIANLGKGVARYLYGVGFLRCEMLVNT